MNLDAALSLAVSNIEQAGPSDISKEVFERQLIEKYRDDFAQDVRAKLGRGAVHDMEFKQIQYILTPKNRYVFDYRKAALIEPSCLAKYTTLVMMAAEEIEKARVPKDQEIVFSARFKPEGAFVFDRTVGYAQWREKTKELANGNDCSYVVQCDIASFYDRVNIHRVESTLHSIGVDRGLIRQINDLLLFWSKKDSYGIPVGNVASRILAEAALIDIDQYLLAENIKFVRYVDDYRLFAGDITTAQRWMNKLTTRLFRDGLMLNTGKTKLYLARKEGDRVAQEGHEDAEAVIKTVTQLTGGYNRIVRTFVMPAQERFDAFKLIDIKEDLASVTNVGAEIPEFFGIQKLIVACLVQQQFDLLEDIARACTQYMFALDYFVDMLIKNREAIPIRNRENIADHYAALVTNARFSGLEWHEATIASLLSNEHYFRKSALLHIIKSSTKETGTYPSMIALEGLFDKLTRAEFRTVREWFDRSDDWEKRRILHMANALPDEERKAWGKAVRPTLAHDFLASRYAEDVAKGNFL